MEMAWLPSFGSKDGTKILHIRLTTGAPWKRYDTMPTHRVPDLAIPGASKGWTTYQSLRDKGFKLILTEEAQRSRFADYSEVNEWG